MEAQREVEALLEAATGTRARVVRAHTLASARGLVERLTLDVAIHGIGSTVITKQRDLGEGNETFITINLATERTALELISQIVSTIDAAVGAALDVDELPALTDWLVDLADAMRERWPEARRKSPYYPAFDGASVVG